MTKEEIIEEIKSSNLLPYEIGEIAYESMKDYMNEYFDFSSLEHTENNADIVNFYLSAKTLKD